MLGRRLLSIEAASFLIRFKPRLIGFLGESSFLSAENGRSFREFPEEKIYLFYEFPATCYPNHNYLSS